MAAPTTYTTSDEVKKFTGLEQNQYIQNEEIDGYRTRAKGRINTVIASRYALPLPTTGIIDVLQYLAQVELYLAGGNLLWKEYGKDAIGTDKDGLAKIREGEAMLKDISEGKVSLIADDGSPLPESSASTSSSSLPE